MKLAKFNTIGTPKIMELAFREMYAIENYGSAIVRMLERFPPANYISPFLNRASIETEEFFYDFFPIQKLWQNQFEGSNFKNIRNRKAEIVLSQIRYGQFNAVLFQGSPPPITQADWLSFRRKNRRLELVIAHLGHPFNPDQLQGVDLILCASDELSAYYRNAGFRTETLFHSFPIQLSSHAKKFQDRDLEFVFTGSSGLKLDSHQKRLAYLQRLSKEFDCRLYLDHQEDIVLPRAISFSNGGAYEFRLRLSEFRKKTLLRMDRTLGTGATNRNFALTAEESQLGSAAIYGTEMFKVLGNTKLTVQIHTTATKSAGAMRIFESAGMGACLISDGINLKKILIPESEILTFSSESELHKKCSYFLAHHDEMSEIAQRGQTAIMSRHSNKVRAKEFLEIMGLSG